MKWHQKNEITDLSIRMHFIKKSIVMPDLLAKVNNFRYFGEIETTKGYFIKLPKI